MNIISSIKKNLLRNTFIAAFLIRLIGLNQSLWLDEATTVQTLKWNNIVEIVTKFSLNDFHPPLYYLVLKIWTKMLFFLGSFAYAEIIIRLPSIIFSLLTGWYVYKIGSLVAPEEKKEHEPEIISKVGFWSAVFFLFNPLIIYYSQEARMYMMVTFLLTAALYYVLAAIRNNESTFTQKNILLANIFLFLSFITHYGAVFFIVAIYSYVLLKKQWRIFFLTIPGFIASFILISPLLYHQFMYSKQALKDVQNWSLVLGTVTLKNLFLIPQKFTSGRISFYPKIIYYAISGVWMMFVFAIASVGAYKKKIMAMLFVLPLLIGTVFSFVSPLLQYFRFLYLIPILSILLAVGVVTLQKKWISYLLTSGYILFSLVYLCIPMFHREDWRSVSSYIESKDPTESAYSVVMIKNVSDPMKYYLYGDIVDIRDLEKQPMSLEESLIVVPYATEIFGINHTQIMQKNGYKLAEKKSFRGITAEEWKRSK